MASINVGLDGRVSWWYKLYGACGGLDKMQRLARCERRFKQRCGRRRVGSAIDHVPSLEGNDEK